MVEHHALAEQIGKRFVKLDQPQIAHRLRPETRVQKVQHRVRDAADVLVHRHPVFVVRRDHLVVIVRRGVGGGVAHVIPRRIDEGIHRVGFAFGGFGALGTSAVDETLVCLERTSGAVGDQVLWQYDRQILLGNGHVTAIGAVDDGDRCAPVALTGNAPIAQAVLGFLFAASASRMSRNIVDRAIVGHAIHRVRSNTATKVGVVGLPRISGVRFTRIDNLLDGQIIFFRKRKIALVVSRYTHHCAVTIAHQHIVTDPDRNRFTRYRMYDGEPCCDTLLLHGRHVSFHDGAALGFLDECRNVRIA